MYATPIPFQYSINYVNTASIPLQYYICYVNTASIQHQYYSNTLTILQEYNNAVWYYCSILQFSILLQYYLNTTQILQQYSILSSNTTAILPQYNIIAISIPQTPISILHVFQYNSILPIQLNTTHRLNTSTSSQYYPILPILPILLGATWRCCFYLHCS